MTHQSEKTPPPEIIEEEEVDPREKSPDQTSPLREEKDADRQGRKSCVKEGIQQSREDG